MALAIAHKPPPAGAPLTIASPGSTSRSSPSNWRPFARRAARPARECSSPRAIVFHRRCGTSRRRRCNRGWRQLRHVGSDRAGHRPTCSRPSALSAVGFTRQPVPEVSAARRCSHPRAPPAVAALFASTSEADRPTHLCDIDDLAVLSDLDLSVGRKVGGGGADRVHEGSEVLAGERPRGVRRTDCLAGSPALEQLKDRGAQASLFGRDGRHVRLSPSSSVRSC